MDSSADLSKAKDWINQRYAQVCVETHSNVPVSATMTLTEGAAEYTFSSSVERILAMYVTPVGSTRAGALEATSIEDIIERNRGTSSTDNGGSVTHYTLMGVDQFVVWPTPQSADTLTIWYVGLPTALSADADVPALHEPWVSKLLFHGPAEDASVFQHNWQAAQWHAAQYEDWLRRYRTHLNRKKGSTTRQFRIINASPVIPHDPSTDTGY